MPQQADVNAVRPSVPSPEYVWLDAGYANPQGLPPERCVGELAYEVLKKRFESPHSWTKKLLGKYEDIKSLYFDVLSGYFTCSSLLDNCAPIRNGTLLE